MKKRNLALIAGAVAIAGGLAFAQTTMDHSNMMAMFVCMH